MVIRNRWEAEDCAELVSIGSHRLFISTSGPTRHANDPVVIFFTGGGSPIAAHVRLQRLMSKEARVYFYDRSGYDRSELPPQPAPLASDAARELTALLDAIRVPPPYVLVAHSYGGVVARAFLDLHATVSEGCAIAGMALIDTATELMYHLYPHIPSISLEKVAANVDWEALSGLQEESGLTKEEYREAIEATMRSKKGADAEDNRTSARDLLARQQFTVQALHSQPLLVLGTNTGKDYQRAFDAGVERGDGTAEEREEARDFIETWNLFDIEVKTAQLRLSGNSSWQYVDDCGHDIPIRRPQTVVDAVKWVLDRCRSSH